MPVIPLHQKGAQQIAPTPPAILVVNDDPASLLGLTGLLERWSEELHYEVVGVSSGEAALRQVLNREFAAILLDVNMPGLDGFETAEIIHGRPASSSIPIIFVTAYWSDEVVRVKAYQNGAVDYLFTPVVPEILRAKVSVFVGLARKTLELREQADLLERRSSELEHMNVLLREEIEGRLEAERRDREKDEFLAMLGHELRNPLAAIANAAGLLRMEGTDADRQRFAADVIQRQSRALNEIVDDLLNLGRVMYGKVSLETRAVDLAAVAASCLHTFELSGKTTEHKISTSFSPAWAVVDPVRFEQIIGNLFDNALKYTPAGEGVRLAVRVQDSQAEIEISDTGMGIDAELLPRVFDTFVQGNRGVDGGLGIGLSLVRQLVEMHGGTVAAQSEGLGLGCRFTVRLPAIEAPTEVSEVPAPVSSVGSIRILLVDDNDDVRDTLCMMLEANGCVVYAASNGQCALELMERHQPEVALVDIGMPDMDGYEVARRLRARENGAQLRLLALTGFGTESTSRAIADAGFDAHLTKPVRNEELLAALVADDTGAAAVKTSVK
jgi:signal transduction histidine kinase